MIQWGEITEMTFLDAVILHVLPELNKADLLMFCIPQISSNSNPCKEMKGWGAAFQVTELPQRDGEFLGTNTTGKS